MSKDRSFLFYGRSGTGKTSLAGTFPTPILILDIGDKGTDSISDVEDCFVWDITEWVDIEVAYYYLKANPDEYATVVIDTVTGMQQACIVDILDVKNKETKNAGDWGTMTKREWGDVASKMKSLITDFRDLSGNTVFVAQDRIFNMDEEDTDDILMPEVGPRLSPSVAAHINAAVSVIGNTFIKQKTVVRKGKEEERTTYCLRVGPNPLYTTKLRKPRGIVPPAYLVDASYEDIMEQVKGEE